MKVHLALDSGAFSMFRKSVGSEKVVSKSISAKMAARGRRKQGYYESEEYEAYLEGYASFVKANQGKFDYYVTLDAMFDAERTWLATKELERYGLKPMPVFHYGEDIKWLKKYMERCDYIGVGGIARGVGSDRRMKFLRKVFSLTHPTGVKREWKLHGFGVTSVEFMRVLPWHSVDSYSALALSNNGKITVPQFRIKHGKLVGFDYHEPGPILYMTQRLAKQGASIHRASETYRGMVREYLGSIGLTMEELADPILSKGNGARTFANLFVYAMSAQALADLRPDGQPLRLYFSGSVSGPTKQGRHELFDRLMTLQRYGVRDFRWLCTYFDLDTLQQFVGRGLYNGKENSEYRRPSFRT